MKLLIENKELSTKQYTEGFTAFSTENEEFNNQWMKDSGKTLAVFNPKAPLSIPEKFNKASSKSKRKRYQNKIINLWRNLFESEDKPQCSNGPFSIQGNLKEEIPRICTEQSRDECYLPFAFKYNKHLAGGCFMHVWEAGTSDQLKEKRVSVHEKPFTEFFTGGCLFGAPLYGIDQFGNKHSLTTPAHEISNNAIIQSVESPFEIHPDEILTRESLINIIHMIKATGNENTSLKYHLPFANYIIYGINWFLKGHMTKQSLADYIKVVNERVSTQKSYLESVSNNFELKINACSTFDILEFDKMDPKNIIEELLVKLDVPTEISDNMTKDKLSHIRKNIFQGIVTYMSKHTSKIGEVWGHIKTKIEEEAIITNDFNLLTLNYVDYSANIAVSSSQNPEKCTASVLPSNESPVNHWYKKIFAERFGSITCFQWLQPIQIHDEKYKNRVFYLSEKIEELNQILKHGLIRYNFIQTAAIVNNDNDLKERLSHRIQEVLLNYKQLPSLKTKAKKPLLESNENDFLHVKINIYPTLKVK